MRILHTCNTYWPLRDGVSIAMQRISEGLAGLGHDVTVATSGAGDLPDGEHNGVRIVRFALGGNCVTGYTGDVPGYQGFVRSWRGDVMLNYAAQICTTDLVFPFLRDLPCRKVLVPCGYSGLYDDAFAGYFRTLPRWLEGYDTLVYLSEHYRDKEWGDRHGLTRSVVIGNGASEDEFASPPSGFRRACGINERTVFLCVSNFGLGKGQHLLVDAFREARLDDATLVLIGSGLNPYASVELMTPEGLPGRALRLTRRAAFRFRGFRDQPRGQWVRRLRGSDASIRVLTDVPREMIVSAYAEADLFLLASEVECAPLVLYEAMAAGTPFVCTPVGNAADLPGGVVRPAEEFAAAMRDAVARPEEWRSLGRAGRAFWAEQATWRQVVGQYQALYRRLSEEAPS